MSHKVDLNTEIGPGSRRFRDLLERERADMAWLVHCVASMYDNISGGRITIPSTYPEHVVEQHEQRVNDARDEIEVAVREYLTKEFPDAVEGFEEVIANV